MTWEHAHLATAYHALVLVVAERALIADPHEGCRAHVAVTDWALSVALVAEASDGDSGLLPAHYKIAEVGISCCCCCRLE